MPFIAITLYLAGALYNMQKVTFKDIGNIEYGKAFDYQAALLDANLAIKAQQYSLGNKYDGPPTTHYLLFCQHPHVYTLGKSGFMENLLVNDERLKEMDVTFYKTDRGGDITYHGPGQIVGYPILDLERFFTDLGRYMRSLEEVIIITLAHYGIKGDRLAGSTGVWLDPDNPAKARKICAMGVRCSRWLTKHGFAFNINTNLSYFNFIVPCGITDKGVTSLQKELGHPVDVEEVKVLLKDAFQQVFGAELV
jgi:lipoyl(octanoyl) transferase